MKKQKGFSLIELLIVVAIILIIAAIAIPNLLRSRMAANEASAVGSVRSIATAEITYQTTNPQTGFVNLDDLGKYQMIDSVLACNAQPCKKSGYNFTAYAKSDSSDFLVDAVPQTVDTTGHREFCAMQDAVVRYINPASGNTAQGAYAGTYCDSAVSALNN